MASHNPAIIMPAYTTVSAYLSSSESRNPPKGVVLWWSLAMAPSRASQNPESRSRVVASRR